MVSDLFMGLFGEIIISGSGLGLGFWLVCGGEAAIIFCVIWAFGCKGKLSRLGCGFCWAVLFALANNGLGVC